MDPCVLISLKVSIRNTVSFLREGTVPSNKGISIQGHFLSKSI